MRCWTARAAALALPELSRALSLLTLLNWAPAFYGICCRQCVHACLQLLLFSVLLQASWG